jgi:hypothetical protein
MKNSLFTHTVEFNSYIASHTPDQIRAEEILRTPSQETYLKKIYDVASELHMPPDLIKSSHKRFYSPLDGELGGNLEIEHILTNAVDPAVLLLLVNELLPLLERCSEEETREIIRDYFFQLIDKTRSLLECYDEIYPPEIPRMSFNMSTNIPSGLLFNACGTFAGSIFHKYYASFSKEDSRSKPRPNRPKGPFHPHLYVSDFVSPYSRSVRVPDIAAHSRVQNVFLSLSSFPKEGMEPYQALKPYIPKDICRYYKESSTIKSTDPVMYPLLVKSYDTIQDRIELDRENQDEGILSNGLRPDQLDDLMLIVFNPKSDVNRFIRTQTNYQLTLKDINPPYLRPYENSRE